MDAQYPFASREDIWRVHEEVKDIFATQMEQNERLAKLERRREDDTRIKNLWGPLSPFPCAVSTPGRQEPSFNSPSEPFKGFDQGHQHGLSNNVPLENEEEPRRGASRANSVRFDESSMHGYYSQANRSASELVPARTGSGMGGHALTERSLSHRSDGRQSSSGHSHRTFSLGLENPRADASAATTPSTRSALVPPPGLFILGPVPSIVRCWLTTNFSNDSLLYAAVCTGAYSSVITSRMAQSLGLEDEVVDEDGVYSVKLPVYLPEASVYQSSSRSGSPAPQVPTLTVRFLVRDMDTSDERAIQIFLGSDVLRAHNADILFSEDKILIVDDERNRISVPLVRPEDHTSFKTLTTGPQQTHTQSYRETERENNATRAAPSTEERITEQPPERSSPVQTKFPKSTLAVRTSTDSFEAQRKSRPAYVADESDDYNSDHIRAKSTVASEKSSKADGTGVWGSWRRDSGATPNPSTAPKSENSPYLTAASQRPTRPRTMKVLKPSRQTSVSGGISAPSSAVEPSSNSRWGEPASARANNPPSGEAMNHTDIPKTPGDGGGSVRANKPRSANPVGGASAFGWLNSKQGRSTPE